MSDKVEDTPAFMSQNELFGEYEENEEEEREKIRIERLKEKGIHLPVNELSDSIHPKTQESYNKLRLSVPDTVRYASQRPQERLKRMIHEATGKPPKITTILRKIYRLKDAQADEWICYDYEEQFDDLMGNKKSLLYTKGAYETVEGEVRRDTRYRITDSAITKKLQNYDIPFSKKNLQDILKKDNLGEEQHKHPDNKTQYSVGYTSNHSRSVCGNEHPHYIIKNKEDFIEGTWAQLYEMGQRGLSREESSLARLADPIANDPPSSLLKKQRGYIDPSAISYVQTSYR
jgi:hypothetical protein